MTWIHTIPYHEATGKLKKLYGRIASPDGYLDNILKVHSLRPQTLEGHMKLYKNVLHHSGNTLPKWYLETLGIYVSQLNQCTYCINHHFAGLRRLLNNETRASQIEMGLRTESMDACFTMKEIKGLEYAKKLTKALSSIRENDVIDLRETGYTDAEILEINQVVSPAGDILGLSPNDNNDPDNWNHS
jgi:uncharacterized peroxidase-related enzyme